MFTSKIKINDEHHFNAVVKALKSIGEPVYRTDYENWVSLLMWDDEEEIWCRRPSSKRYEDIPEFEIVAKTSYELKEVKKREIIKIGEKEYYKDELEIALKNIKPLN